MGMANLSSLVHELQERIAAPSTPPNNHYDDDLVIRFRAVLPDLLHASVVPSPSGPLMMESTGFKNKNIDADLVYVLRLPWTYPHVVPDPHPLWKLKCISVQVACKLGHITSTETQLEVLDLGPHDEFEEVIIEAIISMPVIVMWSGIGWLPHI
ncbi:hypothetical protein C1H46_039206 [Malus baccata]|uniref:Uncharacterized protein n=1 Tax=Malus baccata TaxID=106549 RepID=A0A540KLZ7_MALBA|nr:hypothetical protein C1H46_039206 [Malus baccata]